MSGVVQNDAQEFWRPPIMAEAPSETMAGACRTCGTEFMIGARFCHLCGAARTGKLSPTAGRSPAQYLEFLKALELHRLQQWVALSTASFIAFLAGIACLFAAILVGIVYSAQNLADFQAIQLWRIEWLLAALTAFGAGILLKRTT
ncbi:MAG TPA: hypothetical protein VEH30_06160 [Terriglobales bacterium]|nr:hypothetical protein [Terriglobales bacterium]